MAFFGWCITNHHSDCIVSFSDNTCSCGCHTGELEIVDGPKEELNVTEEEDSGEHTPEQGVDSSDGNAD
jgi:hypothetical protein